MKLKQKKEILLLLRPLDFGTQNWRFFKDGVKRISCRAPLDFETEYNRQDRCLKFVNGINKPKQVLQVLTRATGFYLDHHVAVRSLSEFGISNLGRLEICLVSECHNIRVLIENEKRSEKVLPSLKHLSILGLCKLESLWKAPVTRGSLYELKVLRLLKCDKLEFIFSWSMMVQGLPNLEQLVVEDCKSLKEIIKMDGDSVEVGEIDVFSGLKKIVLVNLPELVSLWNGTFTSLKEIGISDCPKLKYSHNFQLAREEFQGTRLPYLLKHKILAAHPFPRDSLSDVSDNCICGSNHHNW